MRCNQSGYFVDIFINLFPAVPSAVLVFGNDKENRLQQQRSRFDGRSLCLVTTTIFERKVKSDS